MSTFEAVEMLNVLKTVNECFVFEAYLLHISVNECYASICLHGLAHTYLELFKTLSNQSAQL